MRVDVHKEKELIKEISEARKSSKMTDKFIDKYTPFIRNEVIKHISSGRCRDMDDSIAIAMFAFYEALMNYDKSKGAFFSLARVYIRNRLIDEYRRYETDSDRISLDETITEDCKTTLLDMLADEANSIESIHEKECTVQEIEDFRKTLSEYNLSLSDIADNAPRQKRTIEACLCALDYARTHQEILTLLVQKKKLPIAELLKDRRIDRKTLERHRKYLVGILLAFTNGFVIIRGHLCQLRMIDYERA